MLLLLHENSHSGLGAGGEEVVGGGGAGGIGPHWVCIPLIRNPL